MSKIIPLSNNILIKQHPKEPEMVNGLYVEKDYKHPKGDVLGVGKEVKEIKVGDVVIFDINKAREVLEFNIASELDIICVVK